jgi:hypothetical protein
MNDINQKDRKGRQQHSTLCSGWAVAPAQS